jgi:hypothetical protein
MPKNITATPRNNAQRHAHATKSGIIEQTLLAKGSEAMPGGTTARPHWMKGHADVWAELARFRTRKSYAPELALIMATIERIKLAHVRLFSAPELATPLPIPGEARTVSGTGAIAEVQHFPALTVLLTVYWSLHRL